MILEQCPVCVGWGEIECRDCNDPINSVDRVSAWGAIGYLEEACLNCGGDQMITCPKCQGRGTVEEDSTVDDTTAALPPDVGVIE